MTFGAAFKLIKGIFKVGSGIAGKIKGTKDKMSAGDGSDKFSEESSSGTEGGSE